MLTIMSQQALIRLWRTACMPFELCPRAHGHHECTWQMFDSDKAGCTRCAYVHVCNKGECSLIETEDAVVCEITGLCVKDKNFMQNDHSDCIAYKGPSTTTETAFLEYEFVYRTVREILCSERAAQAKAILLDKIALRLHTNIANDRRVHENYVALIEYHMAQVRDKFDFPLVLPEDKLLVLAEACARQICSTVNIAHSKLDIYFKLADLRNYIIALLYLMRTGIHIQDVVILPRFKILQYLLPSETILWKIFACKSKIITEIENKYKMRVRLLSPNRLQQLPFLLQREESELLRNLQNRLDVKHTGYFL